MGLMLSVLIVCVGVIEALSCYEHFQYGVIHCATNVYESARRRSSVFLKYTTRRLKLLTDDSMPEEPETVQIVQEDIYGHREPEPDQFKPIKRDKKLEKNDKIQIVKTLLEKPARPKAVRSISMPEFVYTERDIELSKIINSLVIEPIEEINIEVEDVNTEVLSKEFDKLFDEYENESEILLKNGEEDTKCRVPGVRKNTEKVAREPVKINSKRRISVGNDETTHTKKVTKPLEEAGKGSPVDRFTSADFDAVTTVKCNKSKSVDLDVFYKFEDDSKLNELPILVESSKNKLNDAIFENDTPPAELIDKTFEEIYNDIPDDTLNEYEEIEKSILCGYEWNSNANEKNSQVLCVANEASVPEEKILSNNCGNISDPVFLKAVEQLAELIVKDCLNLNRIRKQILENLKQNKLYHSPAKHPQGTKTIIPNGNIPRENLKKSAIAIQPDTVPQGTENCPVKTNKRATDNPETLLAVEYKEECKSKDRTGVSTNKQQEQIEPSVKLSQQQSKALPEAKSRFEHNLDHSEENSGSVLPKSAQLLEQKPETPEVKMRSEQNYVDQSSGNTGSVPPKPETLLPLDQKDKNKSEGRTGAISTEQNKQPEQLEPPAKLPEQIQKPKTPTEVELRSEQNNNANLEHSVNARSVLPKHETLLAVEYKKENKSGKDTTGAKSPNEQNEMYVQQLKLVEQIGELEELPPEKPETEIYCEQRNNANLGQSPGKSEIILPSEQKEQFKPENKTGEENKQQEQVGSSLTPVTPEAEIRSEQNNFAEPTGNAGSVPPKFEKESPLEIKEDRSGAVFTENKIQQESMNLQPPLNIAEQIKEQVKSVGEKRFEQNNHPNLDQSTESAVPSKFENLLPLENKEMFRSEEDGTGAISSKFKVQNEQMESSELPEQKPEVPKEVKLLSEQNCRDQNFENAGSVRTKPVECQEQNNLEVKTGEMAIEPKKQQEQVESVKLMIPPPVKPEVEVCSGQNNNGNLGIDATGVVPAEPKIHEEQMEKPKTPTEIVQNVDQSIENGGSVLLKSETSSLEHEEDRTGAVSAKQQEQILKPGTSIEVGMRSELINLDQSTANAGSVPPGSHALLPVEQKDENKLENRTDELIKLQEHVESPLSEQIEKPRSPPEVELLSEQNNYANLNESTGNAESNLSKSESLLPVQHEGEIKSENNKTETISAEHKIEKDIKHTKALQLENLGEPAFKLEENSDLKLEVNFAKESVSTNFDKNPENFRQNKTEHSDCRKNEKTTANPSSEEAFWLIFSGEYTKAMSKDWHSGHFSCWQCDEALTGQRYVLRDDHPYCIKCYESVFANVCEECNKIIGIDSKDLSYKDKHWHEACFLCNKCRVSLVDKQFGSKADKIYCGNCYDAQFASRCDGCGEIFRAGTKKMEYKTRQWHEKCFCCCVCKTPIGTKSFIPREQEIYCATCYEEKFATRCVKCNKIITSGGVTYKNEPWHRECFTCTNCNTSLAGQRFTSRDEKPYCADCFGELFAKRCTACSRPITGIGGTRFISFEDRHWHNDCFICASCKTSLVGRGFITDGDDIICPECAKQKLM